jgi:hypothetical protein
MAFLPTSRVFNLKTLSEAKLFYRRVGLVFSLASVHLHGSYLRDLFAVKPKELGRV